MSEGRPIALTDAIGVARSLVNALRDACERIEIAGSIRRGKDVVSDIELVEGTKVGLRRPLSDQERLDLGVIAAALHRLAAGGEL